MAKNEAVDDTHVKDLNPYTLQSREALARLYRAKPKGKNRTPDPQLSYCISVLKELFYYHNKAYIHI